jgi:hypothetical protein
MRACVHRCVQGDTGLVGNQPGAGFQLEMVVEENAPLDLAGDQLLRPIENTLWSSGRSDGETACVACRAWGGGVVAGSSRRRWRLARRR